MNSFESISGTKPTWLSLAFKEIKEGPHLNDKIYDVLRAFGKDDGDAPGPTNLDPDDAGITLDTLQARIATELLDEIDADQASMFGRRFSSVSTLLKDDIDDSRVTTNHLLRLALHRRTVQILSTEDPVLSQRKALRVRALVDFIWSQSLVLGLEDTEARDAPTLNQLVHKYELQSTSSSEYNEFSPGVFHATLEGITSDFGPVHINILRIDMKKSSCRMKCIDARKTCTDLPALAKQMGAVAAISGGFFLYSEPDIDLPSIRTDPVGLIVSDGNAIGPPVFRRATILQTTGGRYGGSISLDKVGMAGVICAFDLQSVNNTPEKQHVMELIIGRDNVRCIHRGNAEEVVLEENECGFSIVGNTVVDRNDSPSLAKMPVPLAGFVIVFPQELLPNEFNIMCEDAKMNVSYALPAPYSRVENAMSGGPMFFSDDRENGCHEMDLPSEDFAGSAPPVTFSQDETHDHNLLPRMGVGVAKSADSDNEQLVCVAVDGRNLDRALGLTLQGTSDFLRVLGCTKAMNLDGGSSKRMVVWDQEMKTHRVVCLSTTEIKANCNVNNKGSSQSAAAPSRPVHSAILFVPDEK